MSEHQLQQQIHAAAALRESLAEFDDEDLLRDSIEGETSLHEMIAAVFASLSEDGERIAGISARMDDLKQRKDRFERAVARKRAMIEQAMAIGEIKSITLDEGTLALAKRPRGVVIENEAEIPSAYWKPQPPKLDKAAVKEALKAGDTVPGAALDNGGYGLTIKRK